MTAVRFYLWICGLKVVIAPNCDSLVLNCDSCCCFLIHRFNLIRVFSYEMSRIHNLKPINLIVLGYELVSFDTGVNSQY